MLIGAIYSAINVQKMHNLHISLNAERHQYTKTAFYVRYILQGLSFIICLSPLPYLRKKCAPSALFA